MGKSYRKPYQAITGRSSAKDDKRRAARGVRRKFKQWLQADPDFEKAPILHRYECPWNEVCSWNRDGKQQYYSPRDPWWDQKLTRK